MVFWLILFLASCFIVFYNYAGYAVIVYLFNNWKGKPATPAENDDFLPTVSFIVAAYNEEDCIEQKIANSLELVYPPEKIEYLFISDGSNDQTVAIICRFPLLQSLHLPERKGKSAAFEPGGGRSET